MFICVLVGLVIASLIAANMPKSKYIVVIEDHAEVGKYLQALLSEKSKLSVEELEQIKLDKQKEVDWMSADKAFLGSYIAGDAVAMFDDSYLAVFDNTLVTCGKLRYGVSNEPLRNFIAARRASVRLVEGDIKLKYNDFVLLYDLVCKNKPYYR